MLEVYISGIGSFASGLFVDRSFFSREPVANHVEPFNGKLAWLEFRNTGKVGFSAVLSFSIRSVKFGLIGFYIFSFQVAHMFRQLHICCLSKQF